ncbi:MAG: FHA domain-containing protein [Steroidobacterales bacterium]
MATYKHNLTPADFEETAELPVLPADVAAPASGLARTAPPVGAETAGASDDNLADTASWAPPTVFPATESAADKRISDEERDRLEQNLRGLTDNLRQLEQMLHVKSEQLSIFEREVGSRDRRIAELDGARSALEEQLAVAAAARGELNAQLELLRQQLLAAQEQTHRKEIERAAMAAEHAARAGVLERAQADLQELRLRAESYREALQHAEGRRQLFNSFIGEREEVIAQRDTRIAALEQELGERSRLNGAREEELIGALANEKQRGIELQAQIEALRQELAAALTRAGAADERSAGLTRDLEQQLEMVRALHAQLAELRDARDSLQADVQTARADVQTVEAELHTRAAAAARLERNGEELRAQLESVRLTLRERDDLIARLEGEAASSAAVLGNIQHNLQQLGQAEPTRLLVRTEGDTGIVHVLGRRTTIGRTPDNDIRIDADFISRHHAVVLVAGGGTFVEDLNSTNGVYVNGTRVTRSALAEGDLIAIGKTGFRFVLKPGP